MSVLTIDQLGIDVAGHELLQPFSLQMESGQCWAVLGINGVGKSSLLHTLAGLRPTQQGLIKIAGQPLASYPPRQRARLVSLLFQHQQEYFPCTVLESVLIGRHPYLSPWQQEGDDDQQRALTALEQVGLDGFATRQVGTLSGGELQRVALARVLTQDCPVMLLDEPSNHLDIHHQMHSMTLLQQLTRNGKLVVMALHDVNLALRFCDHVLMLMPNGEVQAGPVEPLLTADHVSALYQHPIEFIDNGQQRCFIAASLQGG